MPGFLSWMYFGVEQQKDTGEWTTRGCLAPEELNQRTGQEERIYIAGVEGIVSLGKALRAALGKDAELVMAREDWTNGYFQVGQSQESSHLFCATAWDSQQGIRIFRPKRLLFGPSGSPYQFCRVETAVVQITCEMFAVPAVPHVDDNITLETVGGMPSARRAMLAVHEALGFQLSAKKAVPTRLLENADVELSDELGTGVPIAVALGMEWNWTLTQEEKANGVIAKLRLPAVKSQKYDARVMAIVGRRKMSAAEAKKISGTVAYTCSLPYGRCGRALARPIREWEQSGKSGRRQLTVEATVALMSLRPLFLDKEWNPILGHAVARRFAIIFSDARGTVNREWGSESLAAVLLMAEGGTYTVMHCQEKLAVEWLQHVSSDQRINECESLAALLGLATFADLLEGVDVLHFVDSTAAQGILVRGYSRSPTLSAVTSAYWTLAGQSRVTVWIGRVPSKLNIADEPTRGDESAMKTHGWNRQEPHLPPVKPWLTLFRRLV